MDESQGTIETTHPAEQSRARWTRLATLGLVLAAAGPLLMFAAGLIFGLSVGEDAAFFLGPAAIALVSAFLVARFGTWSKFVGILAAVLVAMALFWSAFGLFTPNSFFDFVPGVLVIPGVLIAIASCIGAIVASRRGHYTAVPEGGERKGIRITLGVMGVLILLSGILTLTSASTVNGGEGATTVTFSDFEYDQDEYQVEGGSQVLVRNDDPFLHTFTIDDLDVDTALTVNSEELVEIPDEPGTYVVYCQPHTSDPAEPSDDDMAATIVVE